MKSLINTCRNHRLDYDKSIYAEWLFIVVERALKGYTDQLLDIDCLNKIDGIFKNLVRFILFSSKYIIK